MFKDDYTHIYNCAFMKERVATDADRYSAAEAAVRAAIETATGTAALPLCMREAMWCLAKGAQDGHLDGEVLLATYNRLLALLVTAGRLPDPKILLAKSLFMVENRVSGFRRTRSHGSRNGKEAHATLGVAPAVLVSFFGYPDEGDENISGVYYFRDEDDHMVEVFEKCMTTLYDPEAALRPSEFWASTTPQPLRLSAYSDDVAKAFFDWLREKTGNDHCDIKYEVPR